MISLRDSGTLACAWFPSASGAQFCDVSVTRPSASLPDLTADHTRPPRLDATPIRPRRTITRGSATLAADRSAGGRKPEPELDRLSNIIRSFNELFGNIEREDLDKINRVITVEIPAKVAADKAYQNARKNSDRQDARIEHDSALRRVMMELLADHTELFKQFSDNPGFKKWLSDTIFQSTYTEPPGPSP